MYWCEWDGNRRKIVTASEAKANFPKLLVSFYEMNMNLNDRQDLNSGDLIGKTVRHVA